MNIILSVYSENAFKEYRLPSLNNADYQVILHKDFFHLEENMVLDMEVMEEKWKIKSGGIYTMERNQAKYQGEPLEDKDVINILIHGQEILSVIVKYVDSVFHAYEKYRLGHMDKIAIGKDSGNDIQYDYLRHVSRIHAVVEKCGNSYKIVNKSLNGIYVNSQRVDKEKMLSWGSYINIMGLHMVFLGNVLAVDVKGSHALINESSLIRCSQSEEQTVLLKQERHRSEGKAIYHRAPRNYKEAETGTIEIEAPPQSNPSKKQPLYLTIGPSFTMALPMLIGCMMMVSSNSGRGGSSLYMYSGMFMSISSALIGVVWALANLAYQKKQEKLQSEERFEAYSAYLIEKTQEVKQKYEKTVEMLAEVYPETASCLKYDAAKGILWNRNAFHKDFLNYRLGIGAVPFQVSIEVPKKKFSIYKDELAAKPEMIKDNYDTLYDVPVTLDLSRHRLVGIVGGEEKRGAIETAKCLAAQIAANNCYTDVKMGFIYDKNNANEGEKWKFAKWLPHVWSEDKKIRYLAGDGEQASDVLYELTKIFRSRVEEQEEKDKEKIWKPYYVLFVSNLQALSGEILTKYIFEQENDFGLTTVLLTERYEELPNTCEFIIRNTEEFQGMYEVSANEGSRQKILFDQIGDGELERFTRRLSTLKVQEIEMGGEIPGTLTFFEMYHIRTPRELPIREFWAKNRTYDNIRGLLGEKAGGEPCYLDVHEKYHGPHGLVAGTTGSGKSETLQTYMLSLAVNYSPDDISFFIIDYKGGGMANLFSGLPHLAGQISNLSGNQVRRAMISIKSENRRRQRVFTEHGVNNINLYTRLYKNGEASLPVPHLFIIIDEFAELKKEEPEFMQELISVAQVGRSLGVHLILATQKPSGTVDDNIWSNSKFRLCLRVQDRQDSNDMLHKPDAAYITQAGRGYLQVGNDEVYELFQSGYSGAAYEEGMDDSHTEIAKLLGLNGRVEMSNTAVQKADSARKNEKTQLDAVKEYLADMAVELGYNYHLRLWMPVLGEKIYLEEFKEYKESMFQNGKWMQSRGAWSLDFVLGKVDDPQNQSQKALILDFARDGHIAICGNVVSGRSTMMQTMAFALLQKYSPEVVNIYALDFSSKMMASFEAAPHVGGVMFENDLDKISKFFNMLHGILEERKNLFRGGNYSQYVKVHGVILLAIIIFIDNYASFKEKTEERYEELLIRLSKEGVSQGIYLVLSGNGFGMSDITARVGENVNTILCLALQDKFAYMDLLHSNQVEVLPEGNVRGRGLAVYGGRVLEYQTALALEAEDDFQRMEKIRAQCEEMARCWKERAARKIPEIPKKPVWSQFIQLEEYRKMSENAACLPVGYDAANAQPYGIDLQKTYCYLVSGQPRSGKTNFLKACVQSALDKESRICVIDSPGRELRNYEKEERVTYVVTEQEIFGFFEELLLVFKERNQKKNQLISEDYEEEEIFEEMSRETPYFIVIPDLSWFIPFIYQAKLDMRGFLENIMAKGRLHHIYFIGEMSLDKRSLIAGQQIYESFVGYKTGIHFGGKAIDNPVLNFDYLSFAEKGKGETPGVGMLPDVMAEEETAKVVVPLVRRNRG